MKESKKISLTQAANSCHVTRQAIYIAIKKGRLKAAKVGHRWFLSTADLEDYRASKYRRDLREIDGVKVFDLEAGSYSVLYVARAFGEVLQCHYPLQRIYYLLRIGTLAGEKRGGQWVIRREEAKRMLEIEAKEDKNQLKFA